MKPTPSRSSRSRETRRAFIAAGSAAAAALAAGTVQDPAAVDGSVVDQ